MNMKRYVIGVIVFTLLSAAALLYVLERPDPAPLPAKTQARVLRHQVLSAVDSAEIKHLAADRERDSTALATAQASAHVADSLAKLARHDADSLAKVAAAAKTAQDSAAAWFAAYGARTLEADSLRSAGVQKDSSLAIARLQATVADSVSHIWAGHAARSDSLNAEILPLAMQRDRCRILGVLSCPSRTKTAIVAVVLTAAVASGQIRLPAHFHLGR